MIRTLTEGAALIACALLLSALAAFGLAGCW